MFKNAKHISLTSFFRADFLNRTLLKRFFYKKEGAMVNSLEKRPATHICG
jgi:hypothetical protein